MKSVAFVLVVLSLTILPAYTQNRIEDGWKGLMPLKSTRADVEKIFGKGVEVEKWWTGYVYNSGDATFRADYSGQPCDMNAHVVEQLDIPAETILWYFVNLKQPIPLTDFSFDATRFERTSFAFKDGIPRFSFAQWSKKLSELPNDEGGGYGIHFSGEIIGGRDYVTQLHYERPFGEAEKHACK